MNKLALGVALLGLLVAFRSEAEPLPPNQQPMYGGIEKTEAMKKADEDFFATVANMGHTRESGSKKSVDLGWQYFFRGDVATAIQRFNQAWLLNPENGDAYHGFAVVTAQRSGPPAEAEKYFRMAASKPGIGATALVDFARFLNMLGRYDEAIEQGQAALAASPKAQNARMQISYAFVSKRDAAQACHWAKQAKENGDRVDPPDYLETVCRDR